MIVERFLNDCWTIVERTFEKLINDFWSIFVRFLKDCYTIVKRLLNDC